MAKANTPTMMDGMPITTLAIMRTRRGDAAVAAELGQVHAGEEAERDADDARPPAVITSVPTMALARPPLSDVTSCGVGCVKNAQLSTCAPRTMTS